MINKIITRFCGFENRNFINNNNNFFKIIRFSLCYVLREWILRIVVEEEEFSKNSCTPLDYHEGKSSAGFLDSSGTLSRSFLIGSERHSTQC